MEAQTVVAVFGEGPPLVTAQTLLLSALAENDIKQTIKNRILFISSGYKKRATD